MSETELENSLQYTLAVLYLDDLPWEFETKPSDAWARLAYWNSVIEVYNNHRDDLGFLVLRSGEPTTPIYHSLKSKKNQDLLKDYCMAARAALGLCKGKKKPPRPDTINTLIDDIEKLLMDPKPSNVTYNCNKALQKLKQLKDRINGRKK